ncbi:hypothetical protein ES332_A01G154400v1 [Gossypium tomentosum]|uniref:Zinc knuckle CX2CX4HX4C domain-containing protein n=1 Tax=Gossypium tomentosum TaxID=34277 RepID=A0A5D2RRT8_GOSTO|nr:hypothetical protein ES332_A01G154400v1 [Gossypium tomentosum]
MNGGPWSFNNCILLVHQLAKWVEVHHLPSSFSSESLAKNLGNVLVSFLDTEVNRNRWNSYMPIRIRKQGEGCLDASFNNERIPTICYLCGLIGYSESNCRKLIDIVEGEKQHALPWRREGQLFSRADRVATS